MKFAYTQYPRQKISLVDLTPGEQDLLYDALDCYCSGFIPAGPSRKGTVSRLRSLLDDALPSGVDRDYNAEIGTAFIVK